MDGTAQVYIKNTEGSGIRQECFGGHNYRRTWKIN